MEKSSNKNVVVLCCCVVVWRCVWVGGGSEFVFGSDTLQQIQPLTVVWPERKGERTLHIMALQLEQTQKTCPRTSSAGKRGEHAHAHRYTHSSTEKRRQTHAHTSWYTHTARNRRNSPPRHGRCEHQRTATTRVQSVSSRWIHSNDKQYTDTRVCVSVRVYARAHTTNKQYLQLPIAQQSTWP